MKRERDVGAAELRRVLSHYPTGVALISAVGSDGEALGLTVGTFTSISLDPPLVGFFVGRSSATWPRMQGSGRFCANVLADNQHDTALLMASKDPNKHRGIDWLRTSSDTVRIGDCAAWIECDLHSVVPVGDHDLVVGAVTALADVGIREPLLFHRGRFRSVGAQARSPRRPSFPEPTKARHPLAGLAAVWS